MSITTDGPCPFGCIFVCNKMADDRKVYRLHGDCRIPWSQDCYLNRKEKVDEERARRIHRE